MSDGGYTDITYLVRRYTKRLQKFHNADFAMFGTSGDGWYVRACFANLEGRGGTPVDALTAFENALAHMEQTQAKLAENKE